VAWCWWCGWSVDSKVTRETCESEFQSPMAALTWNTHHLLQVHARWSQFLLSYMSKKIVLIIYFCINVCNTIIMYTTYEQAIFRTIAPNPNLVHYFLLECHLRCTSFWCTPTFSGTQVGCKTRVTVPRNPCTQENEKKAFVRYDICLWAEGNNFQHLF
jgi:hypothetical protein